MTERKDDWDDIFNNLYDEFGFDMKKINNEIAKFWESIMKGENEDKMLGPYVYGFSYKVGPDGKPVFQEFGNVPKNRYGLTNNKMEGNYREPLTDINEDNNNIYITYELPGIDKKDIKLTINENNIELRVDKEPRKYYKNIELNTPVDANTAIAKFTNGILDISVKKLNKNNGKTIRID